jgi:hypothetical protein
MQASPKERTQLLRRAEEIQVVIDRARERGEPALTWANIVDGMVAPIYLRRVFGIPGLDDDVVRTVVRRTISFTKMIP